MMSDAKEVREAFVVSGITIADWARSRNFSAPLVYSVLSGKCRASRGESFRIAVALGLHPAPPEFAFLKKPAPTTEKA